MSDENIDGVGGERTDGTNEVTRGETPVPASTAMDYQTALGVWGSPFKIDFNGNSYEVSFRTQRFKSRIESACKSYAIRNVTSMRTFVPYDDYERMYAGVSRDIAEGRYSYGGAGCSAWLQTPDGSLGAVRAMLGEKGERLGDGELSLLIAAHADEFALYRTAIDSLRAFAESDSEKKSELTRLGLLT